MTQILPLHRMDQVRALFGLRMSTLREQLSGDRNYAEAGVRGEVGDKTALSLRKMPIVDNGGMGLYEVS